MAIKWPLTGNISSPYGDRRNRPSPHSGTDITGANGTAIKAGATGRVHHVGPNTAASGNVVTVIYGNLYALYSHVEARYPVKVGQTVTAGQTIAYVGSSGNSSGGHVHIECYLNGRLVNPEHYFAGTISGTTPAGATMPKYSVTHMKKVQTALQKLGYDLGPAGIDGLLGNDKVSFTSKAVWAYQKKKKLKPLDGLPGPDTLKHLEADVKALTPPKPPKVEVEPIDYNKLAAEIDYRKLGNLTADNIVARIK